MSDRDPARSAAHLTVVIPARDAAATIGQQLTSITDQSGGDHRLEVIVVDDGSSDGTAAVARSFEGVAVLQGPNRGPSAARNAGASVASTGSLCFVDADDLVAEGWVAAMFASLRAHEVVTGPLELSRLNEPAWAGTRGTAWGTALDRFEDAFPYASSCNLGIRRSVFEDVGGFDEALQVGEDLELCLRLALAGHGIHFDDRAVIHYRTRAGLRAVAHQAFRYGRAGAAVSARARQAGLRTTSGVPRRALWLVRRATLIADPQGRARWVWLAAHTLGRVLGDPRRLRRYRSPS